MTEYKSWNNYPKVEHSEVKYLSMDEKLFFGEKKYLAYGLGRSYGDVCLNDNGHIVIFCIFMCSLLLSFIINHYHTML